jgi:hypothetical protein
MRAGLIAVVAFALAVGLCEGNAMAADTAPREQVTSWSLAERDGKPRKVTRRTRHVRIAFGVSVCSDNPQTLFRRITVKRTRRSVVITATVAYPDLPEGTACPAMAIQITRRVSLKGPLGRRSIRDGAFSPPRVVVKVPKR